MTIIQTTKELRKRAKHDYYRTPLGLSLAAVQHIAKHIAICPSVLDPGAGCGVWGEAVARSIHKPYLVGVEIREEAEKPTSYNEWHTCDFMDYQAGGLFNLIVGNPPFNQAEEFINKCFDLLAPDGWLLFVLRLAFLEGQGRYTNLYSINTPDKVLTSVRRVSWTQDGSTDDTAFAVFYWRKSSLYGFNKSRYYHGGWLNWDYEPVDLVNKK